MRYGSAAPAPVELLDREEVMRESLRRESVAVLSHQLDVERREQASYARTESAVALFLLGAAAGAFFLPSR